MASEIRVGGVRYQLAGTSEQGNVYVIQTGDEEDNEPSSSGGGVGFIITL